MPTSTVQVRSPFRSLCICFNGDSANNGITWLLHTFESAPLPGILTDWDIEQDQAVLGSVYTTASTQIYSEAEEHKLRSYLSRRNDLVNGRRFVALFIREAGTIIERVVSVEVEKPAPELVVTCSSGIPSNLTSDHKLTSSPNGLRGSRKRVSFASRDVLSEPVGDVVGDVIYSKQFKANTTIEGSVSSPSDVSNNISAVAHTHSAVKWEEGGTRPVLSIAEIVSPLTVETQAKSHGDFINRFPIAVRWEKMNEWFYIKVRGEDHMLVTPVGAIKSKLNAKPKKGHVVGHRITNDQCNKASYKRLCPCQQINARCFLQPDPLPGQLRDQSIVTTVSSKNKLYDLFVARHAITLLVIDFPTVELQINATEKLRIVLPKNKDWSWAFLQGANGDIEITLDTVNYVEYEEVQDQIFRILNGEVVSKDPGEPKLFSEYKTKKLAHLHPRF